MTSRPRPGCTGSRCSRGVTSTTPRPAAPRSTRRPSPSLWAEAGHRSHDAHLVRGGPAADELARRLPGDPQGGSLHGVPAGRVQRDDGLARRPRRPGRDLERHAVLLAAVGPHPAHHVPAPRPRRDVGHDAAAPARARSANSSSRGSRRRSTGARRSSRCRTRRSASWSTTSASGPTCVHVVPPGIDPRFSPGRREVARRRSSSRSAGSCR